MRQSASWWRLSWWTPKCSIRSCASPSWGRPSTWTGSAIMSDSVLTGFPRLAFQAVLHSVLSASKTGQENANDITSSSQGFHIMLAIQGLHIINPRHAGAPGTPSLCQSSPRCGAQSRAAARGHHCCRRGPPARHRKHVSLKTLRPKNLIPICNLPKIIKM